MTTVALVMIAKNEAAVIGRCLESVKPLVDEMVVVDTGSSDNTKEIALSYGALVYDFQWTDNFSDARNFALSKTTCQWALVLDADDYITNDCGPALRQFIEGVPAIGRVKIIDKFKGKDGDSYAQSFVSRLYPSHLRYSGVIHEQLNSDLPRIIVGIEYNHDGYYQNTRSQRNIPLLQKVLATDPSNAYYHYQIAKEYRGLEDHAAAYNHLEQAYRHGDPRAGFYPNIVVDLVYAAMGCEKLKEVLEVVQLARSKWQDYSDIHFVSGLYYLELIMKHTAKYMNLLPEIERCYLTCLEIGENNQYDSVLGTGSYLAYHNLGVFYEVTGALENAKSCYEKASKEEYEPSKVRLRAMTH
ncbi:glycosyltransferase family 2 protein [Paenibacillus oryzae]|nr:glycosyltransferase family 2 protein [Paenibacillus oryzae]